MHRRTYGGDSGRLRGELIGRRPEMAELTRALAAARKGAGGVVVVWGGAGVGKTRLLAEFAGAAEAAGTKTATAACFEYVRPAFGPFDDVFRRLGQTGGDASPRAPARNASDAAAVKHARFSASVARLTDAASTSALAVTIDDLQWADLGSLELLSFAAARLRDDPVLLIAAVRTDDIERDAARFEMIEKLKRDAAATVEVRPLSDDEMRRLIDQLCGDAALPESQIARLCALAEGRPYFAEELVVNALRAGDGEDALAPPSIRSSVLARLAGLAPAERAAILHAAAIGRRFDAAFLAELLDTPLDGVWNALASARDLQLVVDAGDSAGELAFRHAITCEVIYRELLAGQARAIHTRIAELLARRAAADPTELAYHWKAGGNLARAAEFSEAAGDAAFARDAYEDAAAAYRRALESPQPHLGRPELCEKFSHALSICGNVAEALDWSRTAVDGYVDAGDSSKAAACALWLSRRQYDAAQSERAISTVQWALDMLGTSPDTAARFDAYMTIASFETLQGRTDAAARHLAIAEALEGGQRADLRSSFYTIRAMVLGACHRLRAAFEDYSRALEFARQSGSDSYVAWTLNNYASRATDTGYPDVALPLYDEAIAITTQKNLGKIAALASQGFAVAQLLGGRIAEATDLRRRGSRAASAGVLPDSIAASVALRVAFLTGDDAPALRYLEDETLERGFAAGETQIVGLLAGCAGALLDALGRRGEAARLRSRALARINGVNSSYWLLDRCAECGDPAERARARGLLVDAATDPDNRAAAAYLALFDARVAAREEGARSAKAHARGAAERFAAIGWPWEEGQACELAGEPARALALYKRHGFAREVRRLTEARRRARHRPHSGDLTPRELDVARLAAAGLTNRRIAESLLISRRTVETHIASMFDRFDLTSRVQLVQLLAAEKTGSDAT